MGRRKSKIEVKLINYLIFFSSYQPSVFDTSFENELWNKSGGPKLLLVIDFKHPELTPEDDILHPSNWEILDVDGSSVYQMKPSVLS